MPTRLDYCQFLLSSHVNFTMTHYAEPSKGLSHDAVNRYLRREKMTSHLIWEHVQGDLVASPHGCMIFDDSVLDKNHSHSIELVRRQYNYCPLKANRQVDDSGGESPYRRVDALHWSEFDFGHGKLLKIKGFPKEHKVKLFRVVVSTNRTDWVATNDLAQESTQETQDACALRWKIEQFHRELKQLTGVEKCQCRKARIQRNHIACAVLVWIRLTSLARKTMTNVYQLKRGMLSDYLRQELRSPSVTMAFA